MRSISLEEMDAVKLMDRVDTKFVLNTDMLADVFKECRNEYSILTINNEKIFPYNSLYIDTNGNELYLAHHNGRVYRYKMRFRKYSVNNLSFFEIKFKTKGNRTLKHRIPAEISDDCLSKEVTDYIQELTPYSCVDFKPKILTDFYRSTLVSHSSGERITIDTDLSFSKNGSSYHLNKIGIIEIKKDLNTETSKLEKVLKYYGVHPLGFSKYCIGRALLEKELKCNNFKEKLRTINKISNGEYYYRLHNK